MADLNMDGLVDHLTRLLGNVFANDISQIYYGDIGVYPPKAFKTPTGQPRSVISILPDYDKLAKEGKTGAAEYRDLRVLIVVMVDMTPYFEALPPAAFGEKQLVVLTERIRAFLNQDQNFDLGGKVTSTNAGDVQWNWVSRGNKNFTLHIRAAAIEYEAKVYVPRT